MITIEVCKRLLDPGKYHAQIKDHPEYWAVGDSVDEAAGNLVRYHPEQFGIEVRFLHGSR